MSLLGLVLVVILVLVLLGGVGGPYIHQGIQPGYGFGYGGVSIIGILLIIVIVLLLTGRI